MTKKRKVWFSKVERDALITAIGFIQAGEWDETITQRQYDALNSAREKLEMDSADAAVASASSWDEEYNCRQCGVVIGNNVSVLCLVCSDIAEAESAKQRAAQIDAIFATPSKAQ